jgi:hypothetical protein
LARVFLAVDFENLYRPLGNPPFEANRGDARDATLGLLAEFRAELEQAGHEIAVARVFADWEAMPRGAQRTLSLMGIEPVYVAAQPQKSSADQALALDVLRRVLLDRDLDHVAIIGGDRDFMPMLAELRLLGRSVTIAALASSIGADVRTLVANWPKASIVELDSRVRLPIMEALEASGASRASPMQDSQAPEPEVAQTPRPATTEQWAPLASPPAPQFEWTPEHAKLVRAMTEFMAARGYTEVYLRPFFDHLKDKAPFGPRDSTNPHRTLDDLKAMGIVDIEQRPSRNGFTFAVATLNESSLPASPS